MQVTEDKSDNCSTFGRRIDWRPSLLVGQDEDGDGVLGAGGAAVALLPAERALAEALQLHLGLLEALGARRRVDDEDDSVGAARVAPPQRPQLVLPADVPHRESRAQPRADL